MHSAHADQTYEIFIPVIPIPFTILIREYVKVKVMVARLHKCPFYHLVSLLFRPFYSFSSDVCSEHSVPIRIQRYCVRRFFFRQFRRALHWIPVNVCSMMNGGVLYRHP